MNMRTKLLAVLIMLAVPFGLKAALTEGNETSDVRNPAGSSYSFSHTQNTGDDGHLVIIIASPAVAVSSVTYNGVAMTEVRENNTAYSVYWSVWELDDPATGSNTFAVTLNSGNWNNVSTQCYSFTGCSGVGNTGFNNTQAVGQTTSVSISENSMIIGSVIAGNATSAYVEIPQGTGRTLDWNHNISNYHFGGVSPSLTSGTKTVEGGATASNIMLAVEVQEAAAAASRRVIIIN